MPFPLKLRMSFTGGLQMMKTMNDISDETHMHFTRHALNRFCQRVIPLLPDNMRVKYRKSGQMKQLMKCARWFTNDVRQTKGNLVKVDAFLTIDGCPIVPLTFVLNPANNIVITLYTQGGWDVSTQAGKIHWRWFS